MRKLRTPCTFVLCADMEFNIYRYSQFCACLLAVVFLEKSLRWPLSKYLLISLWDGETIDEVGCFSNWNSDRNFLRIPEEFCSHLFANKKKLMFVSRQDIIKFLSEKRDGHGILLEFSVGKLTNLIFTILKKNPCFEL